MQKSLPIQLQTEKKFSKMPPRSTKIKTQQTVETYDTTQKTTAQVVTAPCQKRGDSSNLKFCAFN